MAFCSFAQVVDIVSGLFLPVGVALKGNDLYVSQFLGSKVSIIDISQPNPNVITLVSFIAAPTGLLVNGNDLYVNSQFNSTTYKVDLSQTTPTLEVFVQNIPSAEGLLIFGNDLYISYKGSEGGIKKVDINNPGTVEDVISGCEVGGMVIKNNVLYFTEYLEGTRVKKFNLGDANPIAETVLSGLSGPNGLTLNGNFLYISEVTGNKISRIDVTQQSPIPEVVVTGLAGPSWTVFDGLDMYFSQETSGKVSKLALNIPVFSVLGSVCSNTMPNNLGGASPTGGTYSGPGVTNNGDGETFTFNPAAAGGAGTYTIIYTAINGNTATAPLTVAEAPVVITNGDESIPVDFGTVPTFDGLPAGGTYSGPGVLPGNLFDPYLAGVGMHTITYTSTAANGCSGSASFILTVTPGANDACDGATSIDNLLGGALNVPQVSTEFNNTGYITADDPSTGYDCFADQGGPSLEHTVWYTFTGDGSTYRIRSVNCNNATPYNDDTQVAIYAGACNSPTPVACNDDENAPAQVYNFSVEVATQAGTAYRMLVDGYDGKEGRFCLEVTNLMPSAATEIGKTDIGVFPNPTTGVVQLTHVKADQVQVFDNMGRLVFTKAQPGTSIDISGVPAGMYFLKITEGEGVYSVRVVKE